MRMNRMRKGQLVFDKVHIKYYRIGSVENGAGYGILEDKETGERFPEDRVCITEQNAICFRIEEDPDPTEIPVGYHVTEDGILMKFSEKACDQGCLSFKQILYTIPGYIILEARTKDNRKGYSDIFSYCPEKDTFRKIKGMVYEGQTMVGRLNTEHTVIGCNHFLESEIMVDGVKKKIRTYDETQLILIRGLCTNTVTYNQYLNLESHVSFIPFIQNKDCCSMLIPCNVEYHLDDEPLERDLSYHEFIIKPDDMVPGDIYPFGETAESITRCHIDDRLFFRSKNRLMYDLQVFVSDQIKKLDSYDHLVDRKFEIGSLSMTIATKYYDICRLKIRFTKDRGVVIDDLEFSQNKIIF
ncbi:MAG: hypothetical protein Q4E53_07610 [Eubacteriales bacterium]|nr:hypothetical protein [Eubacteriales bacterium]